MSTCLVPDCVNPARTKKRGLCKTHERHGPDHRWLPKGVSMDERLRYYSRREGECLVWTATRIYSGYGLVSTGGAGNVALAHRAAYETWVGPIPEGMDIDHICFNRACIEPTHLRPLSASENRAQAQKRRWHG